MAFCLLNRIENTNWDTNTQAFPHPCIMYYGEMRMNTLLFLSLSVWFILCCLKCAQAKREC